MLIAYKTKFGSFFHGLSERVLDDEHTSAYRNKVDLIFTSPPFILNSQKKYGNFQGDAYIEWIKGFAPLFRNLLSPTGSIVVELGNAWEPKRPVMSTLPLKALLAFQEAGELNLCQQFIWHNPARLPGPVTWVNKERIRVKDNFTHIWWMSPVDRPKADNRQVLKAYSDSMQKLLRTQKYNSGARPSAHNIGASSFLTNNAGAIPGSVISISNTHSGDAYAVYCRANNIPLHPARMPKQLAEFFIKFLTDEGDLVLDPFAGSNTTGAAAESLGRQWVCIEKDEQYIEGSKGRFGAVSENDEMTTK